MELHDGFIAVDDNLQSLNTPDVFAAGDVAVMVNHPRPKAGVFAVRQGPPLAANIRHKLVGEALEPHEPQVWLRADPARCTSCLSVVLSPPLTKTVWGVQTYLCICVLDCMHVCVRVCFCFP